MPTVDVVVSTTLPRSMRCRQVESVFDVPPSATETLRWQGEVPLEARDWRVGLIVGPSGAGKSTVARALFDENVAREVTWADGAVLDGFPATLSLTEIIELCRAVGFNTIPAWMRPFRVLSNGERFRVTLARHLADAAPLLVLDEFSSVVDRQVAKITAHATQRLVRKRGTRFVAVTCHEDVEAWLNPDWVLRPETMTFSWRSLQPRPRLRGEVAKVKHAMWSRFARYHYMSAELHRAAQCYALFIDEEPVSFTAVLPRAISRGGRFARPIWGGSRAVTLPDWQGLGLTFALREALGAAFAALGRRFRMYPSHPTFVRSHLRSPLWREVTRLGTFRARATASDAIERPHQSRHDFSGMGGKHAAVFEYVGPAMADADQARALLAIPSLSAT